MNCSPPGSSVHGDSPGKNTGVGCHALLQTIFLTQGSISGVMSAAQVGRFFTTSTAWEAHFPHYLFILHRINSVLSYVQHGFSSTVSLFPSLKSLPISPSFHIISLKFLFKLIYLFYVCFPILYMWFPEKLHIVE